MRRQVVTRDLPRAAPRAAAACFLLVAAACSGLTEVDAPDVTQPSQLDHPRGADAVTAAAFVALNGTFGAMIQTVALFTDELTDAFGAPFFTSMDRRALSDSHQGPVGFAQARTHATYAIALRHKHRTTPRSKIGELFATIGLAEMFLGETMCNGTPLSGLDGDFNPLYGEPLTSDSISKRALASFDSAMLYAADSARVMNYARLGRARVLLNLGRFAEAAAAAAPVPTSYVHNAEFTIDNTSPGFIANQFWNFTSFGLATVGDREGRNGMDFVSAADPRVPTRLIGKGPDRVTDVYVFTRYTGIASPVVISSGVEARLIEAEAALRANPDDARTTGDGWLGVLNTLRATQVTPSLAPLADPGSFDARVDLLYRERALWLYATGHRLGDLRRLLKHYGRSQESTYPAGPYKGGLTYGEHVVFTLGLSEQGNPLVPQGRCADLDP